MRIPPDEWERVIARYSNSRRPNSPAWKLARFLRDDRLASEMVRSWIETQALKAMDRGNMLTAALLTNICKRTSIEALIHDHTGVSVRLIRAGVRYEKRLAAYMGDGRMPPRSVRERIWDEAVDLEIARQDEVKKRREAKGETMERTWLPYHDGRSSRPGSDRLSTMGGLTEWEALFDGKERQFLEGEDQRPDADPALSYRDPESFTPDAAWLAEHHITIGMLDHLSDEDYRMLGIDPERLHLLADGNPYTPDGRKDDGRARIGVLASMLGGMEVARHLVEDNPGVETRLILVRFGMLRRCAETGIRFERFTLADPETDRMKLWARACGELGVRGMQPSLEGFREYCRQSTSVYERCRIMLDGRGCLRIPDERLAHV